jgi:cytochrome P450
MSATVTSTTPSTQRRLTGPVRVGRPSPVLPGLTQPVADRFDDWLLRRSHQPTPLATPPPGLKPVMGDPGMPVLGYTMQNLRLGLEFMLHRYETYGPVSWMRAFGMTLVSVGGGDAVQEVLTNKDKAFSQQGWTAFIGPFFHRGLMLMDFDEHLAHRRLMQQAFTPARLAGYLDQVSSVIDEGLNKWPTGPNVQVYPLLKRLTLDVAVRTFMGGNLGADRERLTKAFIATVRAGTAVVRKPVPGGRWAAGLQGRKVLEEFFRSRVAAKRASDDDDLFAALCHARDEDGSAYTDEDIVNHMIFLMMAAHDTSTIATSAVVYFLAKYPDWQKAVRAECSGDAAVTTDLLAELSTLDMVIRESMRLVAPVHVVSRQAVKDTSILGHYVPAGTIVGVSTWLSHMLPEYWTDPLSFDPERFSPERREDRAHRYAWMPFGGGVHKCIGMVFGLNEIKTLVRSLTQRFDWSVPATYRTPWDPVSLPIPADGLPVALTRRT